jgi:DNA topoisomerase-1
MAGLTAKVFRTYNASFTFQEELKKTKQDSTIAEKVLAYNRANREVAVLCNHQRAVAKTHDTQMEKLSDKILGVKYERQKIKEQIKDLDDSRDFDDESDIDKQFIERYEKLQTNLEIEKREKQLVKENEKRKEQNQSPLTSLPKKSTPKPNLSLEKLEKKLEILNARILNSKTQLVDKDENKQTALGTSKINYIDPRISAAWCHKFGVPLDKIFNRSLREKFVWAMDTKADYVF